MAAAAVVGMPYALTQPEMYISRMAATFFIMIIVWTQLCRLSFSFSTLFFSLRRFAFHIR